MHVPIVIGFFVFASSCKRVLINHIGFVSVAAAKPADDALNICIIGESGGKICLKKKRN